MADEPTSVQTVLENIKAALEMGGHVPHCVTAEKKYRPFASIGVPPIEGVPFAERIVPALSFAWELGCDTCWVIMQSGIIPEGTDVPDGTDLVETGYPIGYAVMRFTKEQAQLLGMGEVRTDDQGNSTLEPRVASAPSDLPHWYQDARDISTRFPWGLEKFGVSRLAQEMIDRGYLLILSPEGESAYWNSARFYQLVEPQLNMFDVIHPPDDGAAPPLGDEDDPGEEVSE